MDELDVAKNNTPRISVNKLAEYVVSKAARQRQILRDQKFPQDYKVIYYKEASEAIALCLGSNLEDLAALQRAQRVLEQMSPDKIGAQRRVAANIDAIESFEAMLDSIDLHGGTPELGASSQASLVIQGVTVSVRPEIVVRGQGRSGKQLVGAMKIHFPRTFPLNDDAAGYVSAITQEYCRLSLTANADVYAPFCSVLDVGSRKIHAGVRATAARMRDVDAVCRNIAALWPSITADE